MVFTKLNQNIQICDLLSSQPSVSACVCSAIQITLVMKEVYV